MEFKMSSVGSFFCWSPAGSLPLGGPGSGPPPPVAAMFPDC